MRSRTWLAGGIVLIMPHVFGPVHAQEPGTPPGGLRPAQLPPRVGVDAGTEPLELRRAVEMALANNPQIVIARLDTSSADAQVAAARGAYDPRVTSDSFAEHLVSPIASIIGGGADGRLTQDTVTGNAGVDGLTPWGGGSYQVDFFATRFKSDNAFLILNPQFPTTLRLSYAQPLGRGRAFDAPRREIELSRRSQTLSLAAFRQVALDVVMRVEQAYWSLVFAHRNLETQQQALNQARAQVASNRRMADAGILAPIGVVEAETQAATFEQAVYTAQEAVSRAEHALKQQILPERTSALWQRALMPTTATGSAPGVEEPDVHEAVQRALANRPEMLRQDASAEIADVNVRFFQEQTRPQVDLVGTYALAGLAGSETVREPNPILPPSVGASIPNFLIGGLGQSLETLADGTFPTARLDLRLQVPLRNRTAEANLAAARIQEQRVRAERTQVEQGIESEVRTALQVVRSTRGRLAAAAAARVSAQEQYESEQRQFEAGTSTVFLVLQRQTAFVNAQAREIFAETDLQNALAALANAVGDGLDRWNIRLQPTTPASPPTKR